MSMPAPDLEEKPPAVGELAATPDASTTSAMPHSTPEQAVGAEPLVTEGTIPDQTESAPAGWTLIALIPFDGREPPASD